LKAVNHVKGSLDDVEKGTSVECRCPKRSSGKCVPKQGLGTSAKGGLTMAKKHSPRFLQIVDDARTRVTECNVEAVKTRLDSGEELHLVDVREESEYARGHLPGAVHIGKGVIERDIEEKIPDVNATIVLYCGGGYRSVLAADALQRMGYTNVISMDGGWRGWTSAAYAVETAES
jgi:rhodanese-related sulfurtransferase